MVEFCFFKILQFVLVVIYILVLEVLLIEWVDVLGFWQLVIGFKDVLDELFEVMVVWEVWEEIGLDVCVLGYVFIDWVLENVYEIYLQWFYCYVLGVMYNIEYLFGLCILQLVLVLLSLCEYWVQMWLFWSEVVDCCFLVLNVEVIFWLVCFC